MKKTTMFLLGISAFTLSLHSFPPAEAASAIANPFEKVSTDHWEYKSLEKLQTDGIWDNKIPLTSDNAHALTRYDIAKIIGEATTNYEAASSEDKQLLDKLQQEYSPELTALGVQFKKAAPESQQKLPTFSGEYYAGYQNQKKSFDGINQTNSAFLTRTRLYINYDINDQWSFTTRLQNQSTLSKTDTYESTNSKDGSNVSFNEAYITGKLHGGKVSIGRQGRYVTVLDGMIYDGLLKGIRTSYPLGNAYQLTAQYGLEVPTSTGEASGNTYSSIELRKNYGIAQTGLAYHHFSTDNASLNKNIVESLVKIPLNKDFTASFNYAKSNASTYNTAFAYKIAYKASDLSIPGSYQVWAQYRSLNPNSYICPTYDLVSVNQGGSKGYEVGFSYVLSKNLLWHNEFISAKSEIDSNSQTKYYFSRLWLFF